MRKVLGKYRLGRKLGSGGFATVYKARDTVEGISVALKIPHAPLLGSDGLDDIRKEIRLTASLDHPHILPIKTADQIDGQFVIAYRLGVETLADRLHRRIATATCLRFGEQMLEALDYAHRRRIIHCDVKPDNLILFPENLLRLTDFGIARVALRTVSGSGSGSVGFLAPEQALGRPSFRSDVFSAGLVIYRMLSGALPEWPFAWPPPGRQRLQGKVPPVFIRFLRRALQVDQRKRFANATTMLAAYRKLLPAVENYHARLRRKRRNGRRQRKRR